MAGFSELIKSFEKTRDYVRDFFIYGYKVRNEFERKSSRTYDNEKRRVESWLGDHLRYDYSRRGKHTSISVDSGHIHENPLYNAYYSKSFTDNDIRLHFLLIDILYEGESLSLKEITDRLSENYHQIFDEQTVRGKLKEYADEGIFVKTKIKKTDYFSLSKDTAASLFEEYEGLSDAVKFFSGDDEFGIVGNSLLKAADIKNDIFFRKHNFIVHTLEDILLPDILEAIENKRYISFVNFGSANAAPPADYTAVPMRILCSLRTGRRYLAAYVPEYKRFNSFRLDYIKCIKKGTVCEDYDIYYEKYLKNENRCFGVSFGTRHELGTVTPVKLTLYINEKTEGFVIDRLNREKRFGTVERISENIYTYTADVFDPNEVMHWAKTFIGRIIKVEGGSEKIRKKFYKDIDRMHRMYTEGER